MTALKNFLPDVKGATAIEYALVAGLISIMIITGVTQMGTSLQAKYNAVATNLR